MPTTENSTYSRFFVAELLKKFRVQVMLVNITSILLSLSILQVINDHSRQESHLADAKVAASEVIEAINDTQLKYVARRDHLQFNEKMRLLSSHPKLARINTLTADGNTVFEDADAYLVEQRLDDSPDYHQLKQEEERVKSILISGADRYELHNTKHYILGQTFFRDDGNHLHAILIMQVPTVWELLVGDMRSTWFSLMLCLCVASLLAMTLIGYMTYGLDDVTRTTKKVTEGDLSARTTPRGHNELATLGHNVNTMIESMEKQFNTINELAMLDNVTGLPNRLYFQNRLKTVCDIAREANTYAALLFIDLDGFKQVNDSLGHNMGDELLRLVGKTLTTCVRENDLVLKDHAHVENSAMASRIGGDEFTLILPQIREPEDAALVANRILEALQLGFELSDGTVKVGASIGISVFSIDAYDEENMVKNADAAMYTAKNNGKNQYAFFSDDLAA